MAAHAPALPAEPGGVAPCEGERKGEAAPEEAPPLLPLLPLVPLRSPSSLLWLSRSREPVEPSALPAHAPTGEVRAPSPPGALAAREESEWASERGVTPGGGGRSAAGLARAVAGGGGAAAAAARFPLPHTEALRAGGAGRLLLLLMMLIFFLLLALILVYYFLVHL
ncbi:hypothetical protein T492DRAFT_457730 [Pavlovales sp. CCMP2436]|nr:hypothetical protein T492DRAFT_457730 [Pavlovales sp. CCMP2436]